MPGSFVPQVKQELSHVALKVSDMQRSLHFYHEVMGLPITRFNGSQDDPDVVWLPGVQLVRGGAGLNVSGTLDHLALGIENLEDLCKHLDAEGVKVDRPLAEVKRPDGTPFAKAAFYYDPDGNRVEVYKPL